MIRDMVMNLLAEKPDRFRASAFSASALPVRHDPDGDSESRGLIHSPLVKRSMERPTRNSPFRQGALFPYFVKCTSCQ
jgi:hypothetical protein